MSNSNAFDAVEGRDKPSEGRRYNDVVGVATGIRSVGGC